MKITEANIEIYLLDFHEGKLNNIEIEQLQSFLNQHSKWKNISDEFELVELPIEKETILNKSFKNELKKDFTNKGNIHSKNIDHYLIRSIENELSPTEYIELKEFLKYNPAFIKDEKLYKYTILKPELEIIFPSKIQLKKQVKITLSTYFIRYASIAAVMILGTYFYFNSNTIKDEENIIKTQLSENNYLNPRKEESTEEKAKIPSTNESDESINQSFKASFASNSHVNTNTEQNQKVEDLEYIFLDEQNRNKNHFSSTFKTTAYSPASQSNYYTIKNKTVTKDKSLAMYKTELQVKKVHQENNNNSESNADRLGEIDSRLQAPAQESYTVENFTLSNKNDALPFDISNYVIKQINTQIGTEVLNNNLNQGRKINWRNIIYASAKYIKSKTENSILNQRKERENSQMIAIKIGEIEIGRTFSK